MPGPDLLEQGHLPALSLAVGLALLVLARCSQVPRMAADRAKCSSCMNFKIERLRYFNVTSQPKVLYIGMCEELPFKFYELRPI